MFKNYNKKEGNKEEKGERSIFDKHLEHVHRQGPRRSTAHPSEKKLGVQRMNLHQSLALTTKGTVDSVALMTDMTDCDGDEFFDNE